MGADLSRVRTDPLLDHSGVGLQQGRLLLDADFNEQVAIVDRRLRAQVADRLPAGVPMVSKLTPDAFKITASGGDLTIGPGRIYVDGLLAENHGALEDPEFDPVLAETRHFAVPPASPTGAVDYTEQPYWLTPEALPTSPGPHLAYLDVWDRELTPLNAPYLVEPAVGVDTTTRAQTVWQVRLLTDVGTGTTCGSDLDEWDDLIAPSAARLTTDTVPVDDVDDICELPPTGGYRGLEHHLYRIELHDATHFKWSRDNASVGSTVAEVVSATELRLASLGRDGVLRFISGDWVEILDDHREFNQLPGVMRKIEVEDATNTITFTPALPSALIPSDADDLAARHLRVIRWDQRGTVVDADGTTVVNLDAVPLSDPAAGLIPIPSSGAAVVLEHGLTAQFSFVDGGSGHPGDYWVCAARSTDATVEKLVAAAPRGIHHHYARLAIVTLPSSAVDCRPDDPPPSTGEGCGCEICVTPEGHASGAGTIQSAVDSAIAAGGGTVILCPGIYPISEPIRIAGASSVTLRGKGVGSTIVAAGPAIEVETALDVTVSQIGVVSAGIAPAILLRNVFDCVVDDITLQAPAPDGANSRIGIGLSGFHVQTMVRRCGVTSPIGVGTFIGNDEQGLLTGGVRIVDNLMDCTQRGVDISGVSLHMGELRIAGNQIYHSIDAAIVATGLMVRGAVPLDGVLTVTGNDIKISGGQGIVTGGRAIITDNEVVTALTAAALDGIVVAAEPPGAVPDVVQVIGNRVTGVRGTGIVIEAPVKSLLVKQNVIANSGSGIVLRGDGPKEHVAIDNNHVLDVAGAVPGEEPTVGLRPIGLSAVSRPTVGGKLALDQSVGIAVTGVDTLQLVGNIVDGVGADAIGRGLVIGIMAVLTDDVRVAANTVSRVGNAQQQTDDAMSVGIGIANATRTVSLSDNTVHSGNVMRMGWRAIVVTGQSGASRTRVVSSSLGTIAFDGAWVYVKAAAEAGAPVRLTGNTAHGGGRAPTVSVDTAADAMLTTNWCGQPPDVDDPAVELTAPAAVVNGNRAQGGRPSMRLNVNPDAALVIGNVTSGDITVAGVPVRQTGKAWSQLNPVVP